MSLIVQRRTPLMCAISTRVDDAASFLVENAESVATADGQWGWTALHYAANAGVLSAAERLLEKRASLYAKSKVRAPRSAWVPRAGPESTPTN